MEAAQVSFNRWGIKQLWDIYTMEYYLAVKKKKIFTLCDSMDRPGEYYCKLNKPVRERNTIWFHSYVESNEQSRARLIDDS